MKNYSYYSLKVCSVEEMRKIDEEAVKYGVNHLILMENAGTAVYDVIVSQVGVKGKKFTIIAGTGNNGGDALVAARRIYAMNGLIEVFIVGDPEKYREPAKTMYEVIVKLGIKPHVLKTRDDLKLLENSLMNTDVVVVGLIGIGLKGEVTGIYRDVIELINKYGKIVVSVDIPSGIDGNNGKVRGVAVRSHYTITFGLPKYGNILYPGYHYCGKLYVSRLSYPPVLLENVKTELNSPVTLPERIKWGHKGTFGKLLAVSGARYYYGAPYYTAYSFLRAGGGYARLATPASVVPVLASNCSEIVYHPMEETIEGTLSLSSYEKIVKIIDEYGVDIVVAGPGVSLNEETQELIRMLVEAVDKPIIVDGDGITAVSRNPDILKKRRSPTVLTPHPLEFSRLMNIEISELQENPIEYLRKASIELRSYIVLKGAHSLIGYPDGHVYINMTGNPGMAKAGMGDVLNGTIAAMYGIGLRDLGSATRMGVLIHGLAGDLAANELGEDGITPDLVIEYLPRAMRIMRENPEYVIEKYMPIEI
ncbi:MAG: NAD(P)H-hydrate dehydratase [Desulfurococcaceae archaeon]